MFSTNIFIMKKIIASALLCSLYFFAHSQEQKKFNDTTLLQPVEVSSIRAGDKAPFTKTNLSKKEMEKNNTGQDIPFILNQTPSVVVNSDAGTGVGYTGIYIRGSDATRINTTVNGIPYNDAESQSTYFVDMPDFISSANSIQIQRGVGTSSNGTGAFGATISLSTNEVNEKAYAEVNNNYGSFNTWKNTVKVGSGLISNHFTIDARLSRVTSDGYIDRASSNLSAFYLSGAYINKGSTLRLNIFSGKEKTYQAWNGVPAALLDSIRTYNSSGTDKRGEPYDNETDNYTQTHYQLFFDHIINTKWSFNTAVFFVKGKGYYENYKGQQAFSSYGLPDLVLGDTTITNTDLITQKWLDNNFYGQIFSIQYKKNKHTLTVGGSWNVYDGKHYNDISWAEFGIEKDYRYFNAPAKKSEASFYAKWEFQLNQKWNLFTDLQYRYVKHSMNGFDDLPTLFISRKFNFINPKAGISYNNNNWQVYFSYAAANKEPNRNDFEAGVLNQPKKETLHDFEAGVEKRKANYFASATIYYMLYKDQLVQTGMINDVGSYTRVNVPNSFRTGIELQAGYSFAKWINVNANLSFSKNKIKSFTEYLDDYDTTGEWVGQQAIIHKKTDIAFSPSVIGGATINILPIKNLELSLISKVVGKQYLDNTQNNDRKLNGFYTQDARIIFTIKNKLFKEWKFSTQANNLFSKKYEPNGYVYTASYHGEIYADKYYFPMAPINWVFGININF